ncbi:MAG: 50S ribosomal protein L1 [Phycisphaerae bacterium]
MRQRSKRYEKMLELIKDKPQPMSIEEAVKTLKLFNTAKFDQSVNCVMNLGIDPKQADQLIRGSLSLPRGIGKSFKVIAFCEGDLAVKAKEAGAIEAGADDLVKKVQDGWMDFDVALATPGMMRLVGRLGRVLGPSGKMPSPKAGTVTEDVVGAVKEYSAGKQEFRNDAGGNIALVVGKLSFTEEDLTANIGAFTNQIKKMKPAASRGTYLKRCVISAAMSPGIEIIVA